MPIITEDSLREFLDWHTKVTQLSLLAGMSDYTKMKVAFEAGWQARKDAQAAPAPGQELLDVREPPSQPETAGHRPEKTVFTRHTVYSPFEGTFQGRQSPYFEQEPYVTDAAPPDLEAEFRAMRATAGNVETFDRLRGLNPVVSDEDETPETAFLPAPAPETPETRQFQAIRAIDDSFDHLETIWRSDD
jgi:hypothetical protein